MLLGACSQGEVRAEGPVAIRNLLEAAPSRTLEVQAYYTPAPLVGWGRAEGVGWADRLQSIDDVVCAYTRAASGVVKLLGKANVDRTLSFQVASLGGPQTVNVTFNGLVITEVQAGRSLVQADTLVPASAWLEGTNELRFETQSGSGQIAVAHIDVSNPQEFDDQEAVFDSGVLAEWDVLLASGGLLELQGTADVAGLVEVVLSASPFGDTQRAELAREAYPVQAGEPFTKRLPINARPGNLLHVSVHWVADSGAGELDLELLGLFEDQPFTLPPTLFISIDTLSAQSMSVYGYDRETTPRLAAFVADSVLFEQARSNAPWTVPSYASQFTGLYASSNRITEELREALGLEIGKLDYRVPSSRLTLAEMLRAAGYRTAAYLDNPWLSSIPGLEQGFDIYDTRAAEASIEDGDMGIRFVLPAARRFIEASHERPPFVIAQALDVHGPYHTRAPFKGHFADRVDPNAKPPLPVANTAAPVFGAVPKYIAELRMGDSPDGHVSGALLRADYDEKLYELDAVLGDFFDELKRDGLYDELLIVLSADHGESMEDHEFFFRHGLVYDSATHVPLMIKLPGQRFAGTRVSTPVQLVDLFPTFAEWMGLDLGGYGHGQSLVASMENGTVEPMPSLSEANMLMQTSIVVGQWKLIESRPKEVVLGSALTFEPFQQELYRQMPDEFQALFGGPPPIASHRIVDACKALKQEAAASHWQLTKRVREFAPHYELYDLRADPEERTNLAAQDPERVAALLAVLESERARAQAHRVFEDETGPGLSDDQKADLEALGYVSD